MSFCATPGALALAPTGPLRPLKPTFRVPTPSRRPAEWVFVGPGAAPTQVSPPQALRLQLKFVQRSPIRLLMAAPGTARRCAGAGRCLCRAVAAAPRSYWSDLRQEWIPKLPFPSAVVAEQRAERAEGLLRKLQAIGDEDASAEQYLSVLTHRARSFLLRRDVFPISRPELAGQLRQAGQSELAVQLELAMLRTPRAAVAGAD